MFDLGNMVERR